MSQLLGSWTGIHTNNFLTQITTRLRTLQCEAFGVEGQEGLTHICINIKCRWLGETPTSDHQKGSEALGFQKQNGWTARILLLGKCEGLDDGKLVSRMDIRLGLETEGGRKTHPPATRQFLRAHSS
jgi:hypothetical protein